MPSDNDIKVLNKLKIKIKRNSDKIKEAAQTYSELLKNGKSMIALFPKNKDVDDFNMQMSKLNNIKLIKVEAVDDIQQSARKKNIKSEKLN